MHKAKICELWNFSHLTLTLIQVLKLYLDIIKMYVCTKNEVPTFSSSNVIIWTDRQTDRQTCHSDNLTRSLLRHTLTCYCILHQNCLHSMYHCYRPKTKLWEGNVFTGVCLSVNSVHMMEVTSHASWVVSNGRLVPLEYPPGHPTPFWDTLPPGIPSPSATDVLWSSLERSYPHYWHLVVILGDLFKVVLPLTSSGVHWSRQYASYWNAVLYCSNSGNKITDFLEQELDVLHVFQIFAIFTQTKSLASGFLRNNRHNWSVDSISKYLCSDVL